MRKSSCCLHNTNISNFVYVSLLCFCIFYKLQRISRLPGLVWPDLFILFARGNSVVELGNLWEWHVLDLRVAIPMKNDEKGDVERNWKITNVCLMLLSWLKFSWIASLNKKKKLNKKKLWNEHRWIRDWWVQAFASRPANKRRSKCWKVFMAQKPL